MGNSKKNLMKEVKKRLNAKLECHLARPHNFLHEIFTLYICVCVCVCGISLRGIVKAVLIRLMVQSEDIGPSEDVRMKL